MSFFGRLSTYITNLIQHSFSYVLIYSLVFNLPIALTRYNTLSHFNATAPLLTLLTEFAISVVVVWGIFAFCAFNKYLFKSILILSFIAGGISDYFIFNFAKTFDIGVLLDILSNDNALSFDFINLELLIAIIISILALLLASKLEFYFNKISAPTFVIMLMLACMLQGAYFITLENSIIFRSSVQNYLPSNIISAYEQYFRKYSFAKSDLNKKIDITKRYEFSLNNHNQPLNVILVIGESMRGDLLHINGYKKYNNTKFLEEGKFISFKNATSTTSYTREALPLMLTRAQKGSVKQALEQTSIISVFKKMGFETAWIGNQGLFADNDYSYGPIAMEASYVISRSDVMREYPSDNYDELLLNFLDQYLAINPKANHFIVLHMMGSHWDFKKRYPKSFDRFIPSCNGAPQSCTRAELENSYNNSVLYSSYVLNQVASRFKNQNAFMLFASDHGFSLYEDGFFGNASNPAPKEQLTIGMFAWGSDSFIKGHTKKFNRLCSQIDKPVGHYNIFHTLLGCIGVRSTAIDNSLNLCE